MKKPGLEMSRDFSISIDNSCEACGSHIIVDARSLVLMKEVNSISFNKCIIIF